MARCLSLNASLAPTHLQEWPSAATSLQVRVHRRSCLPACNGVPGAAFRSVMLIAACCLHSVRLSLRTSGAWPGLVIRHTQRLGCTPMFGHLLPLMCVLLRTPSPTVLIHFLLWLGK